MKLNMPVELCVLVLLIVSTSVSATKYCIVGGGVSGLTAAVTLLQDPSFQATDQVMMFESNNRVGGRVINTAWLPTSPTNDNNYREFTWLDFTGHGAPNLRRGLDIGGQWNHGYQCNPLTMQWIRWAQADSHGHVVDSGDYPNVGRASTMDNRQFPNDYMKYVGGDSAYAGDSIHVYDEWKGRMLKQLPADPVDEWAPTVHTFETMFARAKNQSIAAVAAGFTERSCQFQITAQPEYFAASADENLRSIYDLHMALAFKTEQTEGADKMSPIHIGSDVSQHTGGDAEVMDPKGLASLAYYLYNIASANTQFSVKFNSPVTDINLNQPTSASNPQPTQGITGEPGLIPEDPFGPMLLPPWLIPLWVLEETASAAAPATAASNTASNAAIAASPTGVTVGYLDTVAQTSSSETCDKVLVTVPLGVLKQRLIRFEPDLEPLKQAAINSLGYGVLNKLFLVWKVKPASWPSDATDPLKFYSYAYVSKGGEVYFPAIINAEPLYGGVAPFEGAVLALLSGGDQAEVLEDSGAHDLRRRGMDVARKVLGLTAAQLPDADAIFMSKWKANPHAYGSYSFIQPNSFTRAFNPFEHYRSSVNNQLFFSGEATDEFRYGYLDGAFMSGVGGAQEMLGRARSICDEDAIGRDHELENDECVCLNYDTARGFSSDLWTKCYPSTFKTQFDARNQVCADTATNPDDPRRKRLPDSWASVSTQDASAAGGTTTTATQQQPAPGPTSQFEALLRHHHGAHKGRRRKRHHRARNNLRESPEDHPIRYHYEE